MEYRTVESSHRHGIKKGGRSQGESWNVSEILLKTSQRGKEGNSRSLILFYTNEKNTPK